jgi:hypothetical protein
VRGVRRIDDPQWTSFFRDFFEDLLEAQPQLRILVVEEDDLLARLDPALPRKLLRPRQVVTTPTTH